MAKHTPTPWTSDEKDHDEPNQNIKIIGANGTIATVWIDDACHDLNREQQANADFMLRAVNSHEKLLEALTVAMSWLDSPYFEPPKSCGQCGNGSCDGDCVMAAALSSDYKTMQDAVRAAQGA